MEGWILRDHSKQLCYQSQTPGMNKVGLPYSKHTYNQLPGGGGYEMMRMEVR